MKIFNFKFAASGKLIPLGDLIFNSENGQSLIELIVTIGLAAIILPALLTGFVASRSGRAQGEQRQQAVALVKEGLEAARVYREADWTTFANKAGVTLYYPCKSLDTWSLCTQNVDNTADTTIPSGFKRIISVSNVWRDSNFKIVDSSTSGAYNDGSTKLVTTTVSWSSPLPSSVTASEYLTRTDNSTFTDTSVSDFTSRGTFQA
ncbi:MAG TPA: type II secretion system protein, partial [Patescibacteria group bacterium]